MILRRLLIGALLALGLTYLFVLAALWSAQQSLIYPAPKGEQLLPAGFEDVTLKTADGLDLAAAWHEGASDKPVLVFFHGNGDNWAGGDRATALLQKAGYSVLLPEYRGYGRNPGRPGEAGFYADGRAALAWLGERGIDAGRIVLIGNSMGSGTATQLASEGTVGGLLLISPYASLPDVVADRLWWLPARWLVRDKFDNQSKLGRIVAPVLILQGSADTVVPPKQAARLAGANPRARLVMFPGEDHSLAYSDTAQHAELQWLDALPPPLVYPTSQRQAPAGT